jgi:hypothetical protein
MWSKALPWLTKFREGSPAIYKVLFWALLLVNIRSFPFAWHGERRVFKVHASLFNDIPTDLVRIFRPAISIRFEYYVFRLRNLFASRSVLAKKKEGWLESITPIGANPFEHVIVYKTSASESILQSYHSSTVLKYRSGIDDSDFNGHLSNSSYAKVGLLSTISQHVPLDI